MSRSLQDLLESAEASYQRAKQELEKASRALADHHDALDMIHLMATGRTPAQRQVEERLPEPPPGGAPTAPPPQPRTQPLPPPVAAPAPPPAPAKPTDPGPFPGENSAALQEVLEEAADSAGICWTVLKAIQVWETGHYRDPAAKAWLEKNNPGGMKNTAFARSIGGVETEGTYAKFPNWRAGVLAHGKFLAQQRYNAARQTDDPLEQAEAIGEAGYAEGSPTWLEGVQALVRQYLKEGPSTRPSVPAGSVSLLRVNVVARARSAIGKGVVYSLGAGGGDPTRPLGHESDCSGFADWVLGISRDSTGLNTDALVRDGLAPGGLFDKVTEALPGDLIVYGAGNGHNYGHVGVITEVDAGKPTRVVHCSSSNNPAILETGPDLFLSRGAIVVRYHGLAA